MGPRRNRGHLRRSPHLFAKEVQGTPFLPHRVPPTHHAFQDEVEHQKKAEYVVDTVLKTMDKNQDGQVTPDEFEEAGFKGLPSFDDIGAEGHHYDVESGASFWKSYRRLSETLMMSSH